jgi:hypothetical protein
LRREVHTGIWWEHQGKRSPGLVGKIILKWTLKKEDGGHKLDLSGSEQKKVADCCGSGNEHSDSTK